VISLKTYLSALSVAMIGLVPVVLAEEPHGEGHERAENDSGHHLREHKNEVAIFLGLTDEAGHDSEFTLGVEYKRRIAERWAVGGAFDYAGGELRNAVLTHNGRGGGGHGEGPSTDGGCGCGKSAAEHGEVDEDSTHFLLRIGVGYGFHLGRRFGIVPGVYLDFVDNEEVWVYGLNFTYGF